MWYGKIETTLARAKEVSRYTEKLITLAVNSYEDTVEEKVTVKNEKGKDVTKPSSKTVPRSLPQEEKSCPKWLICRK